MESSDCFPSQPTNAHSNGKNSTPFQQRLTRNAIFASMVATLGAMSAGTIMAYPSPAVHSMNTLPRNAFRVDKVEQSWIGSIAAVGALVGALSSGPLMDTFGRKLAIMISAVPFVVGWTVEAGAPSVKVLCAGRLVTGLCKGVVVGTSHVYLAETAPPSHRGKFLAAASVYNVLGTVCVYALGMAMPWMWLAIACAVVPATMGCLIAVMPETPRYLLLTKKTDEACESLRWFRGSSVDVTAELQEMEDQLCQGHGQARTVLLDFFKPTLFKPLIIVLTLFTIQEFSGNSILRVYAASIFASAGHSMDPQVQSIVLGAFGVLGTFVSLMTVDRFGRKTLLVVSSLLMATCLAVAGVYFKMHDDTKAGSFDEQHLSWIPLISLVVNNFGFALAYDPIPWTIASELFPTRARGIGNSIGGAWQGVCFFLVTRFFQDVSDILHVYGAFWVGATVCLVGAVFAVTILPETMRRTLEGIQDEFTVQAK